METDDLKRLMATLNPEIEAGRLTLIARFGAGKAGEHLPRLIKAVPRKGRAVVWVCDPMHGTTIKSATGFKTRPFDAVLREVQELLRRSPGRGTTPGGVQVIPGRRDRVYRRGQGRPGKDLSGRLPACDPRRADRRWTLAFTGGRGAFGLRERDVKVSALAVHLWITEGRAVAPGFRLGRGRRGADIRRGLPVVAIGEDGAGVVALAGLPVWSRIRRWWW
ncbi:MAG: 3-deoxy-7-phosphoheptulonate synthase [Paracoccaceae bacterium]